METTAAIDKVCAFITRSGSAGQELLVFEHGEFPEAGIQIPAGTVELGEPLEKALLREVQEEAGLTKLEIIGYLGTINIDLPSPSGEYALTQATELLREPESGAEALELPGGLGTLVNRGWYVTLLDEYEGWNKVTYYEGRQPVTGWIKAGLLAQRLVRHLYHLTPLETTPERWNIFAEQRYTFCHYWLPLQPRPHIEPYQDLWLDVAYEQLL